MSIFRGKWVTLKNQKQVWLRSAEPKDVSHWEDYYSNVVMTSDYTLTSPGEININREKTENWILNHRESETKIFLVAEDCGQIIGTLNFSTGVRLKNQHAGTIGMGVHSEWRGLGLGRILIENFQDWVISQPLIERVDLSVMSDNLKAINLYSSVGFVEEGRKRRAFRLHGIEGEPPRYQDEVFMAWFPHKLYD